MWIGVITIFPELFEPFVRTSLLGRAIERGQLVVEIANLRDFTDDPHRVVDDEPFGGGGGMVMTAPPWLRAVSELSRHRSPRRILLSPQGRRLDDAGVRALALESEVLLLCGRYEGVDQRVLDLAVDEELSIGDYVLAGGELPAMVLIEAISREIPGVVGLPESVQRESFRRGLLDFPQYTRPRQVAGLEVPATLLSGDHAAIEEWRELAAVRATWKKRPDLLPSADLTPRQRREWKRLEACTEPARSR